MPGIPHHSAQVGLHLLEPLQQKAHGVSPLVGGQRTIELAACNIAAQRHGGLKRLGNAQMLAVQHQARQRRQQHGLQAYLPALRALAESGVQRSGSAHFAVRRLDTHRHMAARLAAFHDGGDIGSHPVVAPVLAQVLDQPGPGAAMADGGPHVLEGFGRHVGVAHHVVRLPHELIHAVVAADVAEGSVAVGDTARAVRGGHEQFVLREDKCLIAHGDAALCGFKHRRGWRWCLNSGRCAALCDGVRSRSRNLHGASFMLRFFRSKTLTC